jgi:YHS domain-containing protein
MKLTTSLLLLLFCACAGPDAHRHPAAGAALEPSTAPAERAPAGAVLDAADPLDVGEKPAAAEPHHHHHGAAMEPAPQVDQLVEDPVCHMKIKVSKAAGGSVTVNGVTSYFCSNSCRLKFTGGAK